MKMGTGCPSGVELDLAAFEGADSGETFVAKPLQPILFVRVACLCRSFGESGTAGIIGLTRTDRGEDSQPISDWLARSVTPVR